MLGRQIDEYLTHFRLVVLVTAVSLRSSRLILREPPDCAVSG